MIKDYITLQNLLYFIIWTVIFKNMEWQLKEIKHRKWKNKRRMRLSWIPLHNSLESSRHTFLYYLTSFISTHYPTPRPIWSFIKWKHNQDKISSANLLNALQLFLRASVWANERRVAIAIKPVILNPALRFWVSFLERLVVLIFHCQRKKNFMILIIIWVREWRTKAHFYKWEYWQAKTSHFSATTLLILRAWLVSFSVNEEKC